MPMLRYWSTLFITVLLICLLLLWIIGSIWIKSNVYRQGYQLLELRALHFSEFLQTQQDAKAIKHYPEFFMPPKFPERRKIPIIMQVVDEKGNLFRVNEDDRSIEIDHSGLKTTSFLYRNVIAGSITHEKVEFNGQTWLMVGVPYTDDKKVKKALYLSMPAREVTLEIHYLRIGLSIVVGIIGLAGWVLIYFLSRRLTRPLREISLAAKAVSEGEYDIILPNEVKEEEIYLLIESFHHMTSQLKKLEQLRTELLAGVSHELRTPITAIRGMIQAVQGKVVTGEEAENFLQISFNEAKRLQQMVEELLDFSSLEGSLNVNQGYNLNFTKLINEVVQQLKCLSDFKSISFKLKLPEKSIWLEGNSERLRQIIMNLLKNSQKACASEIEIRVNVTDKFLSLDVLDNGKGIAPADQPYIFERFYRGKNQGKKDYGLGLGLTISRLLARAHKGDLLLLSTNSEQTVFRLLLPMNTGSANH
jgi:signal transduction histidine kinase